MALLISGAWLPAQAANKSKDKSSDVTTIAGCVHLAVGEYNLIDETDTIYHLTGGGSKLKHEVGRQVEITGKLGWRTADTTLAGAGSSAVQQQVFEVQSMKEIADTCK
jgi:hypothetical protein